MIDKRIYVLYDVLHMVQIINISQARSTLSALVQQVAKTKRPVVIVQDSIPSVVLYPYSQDTDQTAYLDKLLTISGDWISAAEQEKIRDEVESRIKRTNEELSS